MTYEKFVELAKTYGADTIANLIQIKRTNFHDPRNKCPVDLGKMVFAKTYKVGSVTGSYEGDPTHEYVDVGDSEKIITDLWNFIDSEFPEKTNEVKRRIIKSMIHEFEYVDDYDWYYSEERECQNMSVEWLFKVLTSA
jgi:hypothetical protein